MDKLPHITMVMDTIRYKNNLLEEAVESFLRQSYPHKTLLIHNSHPDPVYFEKEQADIKVLNLRDCWASYPHKMLFTIAQTDSELWCILDDDDIVPSWHLEGMIHQFLRVPDSDKLKGVGHRKALRLEADGTLRLRKKNWGGFCWEKLQDKQLEILREVLENYKGKNGNFDQKITTSPIWNRSFYDFPARPSYIKRYLDKVQLSIGSGDDNSELERFRAIRKEALSKRYSEPLRPHWDIDYEKQINEYLAKT